MFDITKYITENKVTINEAPSKDEKQLLQIREKLEWEFNNYLMFPLAGRRAVIVNLMKAYETSSQRLEKYKKSLPRRPKVPNPRNR